MEIGSTPGADRRPDQSTAATVIRSWQLLATRQEEFATVYLDNLFGGGSGAPRHQDPIAAAALELLGSLLTAIEGGEPPERSEERWRQLGTTYVEQGMFPSGYGPVGRAVVRAVRDVCSEAWSSGLSSAWSAYHLWMVAHLDAGAANARPAAAAWHAFPELAPATSPTGWTMPPVGQQSDQGATGRHAEPQTDQEADEESTSPQKDQQKDLYRVWGRGWM